MAVAHDVADGFDRLQTFADLRINIDQRRNLSHQRGKVSLIPILFSGTILANIAFGLEHVTEKEVMEVIKDVGLEDMIEKLPDGIYTQLGEHGDKLSGGQRQRISIARIFLKNPPILILDEATAFADPDNEAKVQAAFAQLAKGKTVLMIAHRLSTVANADCIYVVQDGQIAESGTKDELCAQNGLFARMWQDYQASVQWKVAKEG